MNCYEDKTGIWRNMAFPEQPYTQFTEASEADPKLFYLMKIHGSMFDDDWAYKFRGKDNQWIVRYPLWSNDRLPVEHAHAHGPLVKHPEQQILQ